MKTTIGRVRHESRRLVRELGFLETDFTAAGITHQQCHAILETGNYGSVSAVDLANYLNLDKSSISRVLAQLEDMRMISVVPATNDRRKKLISLTAKGTRKYSAINVSADAIVDGALKHASAKEAETIIAGMRLYANALRRARISKEFTLRPIRPADNKAVADLIRTVMPEFGCDGPGFAMGDAEVGNMHAAFKGNKSAYFLLEQDRKVVGGGGIAPLKEGPSDTCELKKMYFLPQARGTGMGHELLMTCLKEAKRYKYKKCYLETARFMTQAMRLYERVGFKKLDGPRGNTGHHSCNRWYLKEL
jgi:putative acetyltransferase